MELMVILGTPSLQGKWITQENKPIICLFFGPYFTSLSDTDTEYSSV